MYCGLGCAALVHEGADGFFVAFLVRVEGLEHGGAVLVFDDLDVDVLGRAFLLGLLEAQLHTLELFGTQKRARVRVSRRARERHVPDLLAGAREIWMISGKLQLPRPHAIV